MNGSSDLTSTLSRLTVAIGNITSSYYYHLNNSATPFHSPITPKVSKGFPALVFHIPYLYFTSIIAGIENEFNWAKTYAPYKAYLLMTLSKSASAVYTSGALYINSAGTNLNICANAIVTQ